MSHGQGALDLTRFPQDSHFNVAHAAAMFFAFLECQVADAMGPC
jgi:hypothetical protein